jgi:hypothetical protein
MNKPPIYALMSGIITVLFSSVCITLSGQNLTNNYSHLNTDKKTYTLDRNGASIDVYKTGWLDAGVILGAGVMTYFGIDEQSRHKQLSIDEVFSLDKSDVNWFDRGAIDQDIDKISSSRRRSDAVLNASMAMVTLLALDKNVRREWADGLTLYVESIAVSTAMQSWVANKTNRIRPIAYLSAADTGKRIDRRNKNSFYSGHTASAATSSFFAAKFYCDLHPELGNKKWLIYAGALIPPALVGRYRVKGGKHFYSDVIIGAAMGAASGILVPHLHKRRDKKIALFPVINGGTLGLSFSMLL